MATTVESPGIVSAKEEAAAILFARESQTSPVMSAPVPEQSLQTHETVKRPSFAHYHEPETIPARPKVVDTASFRPYKTYEEVSISTEPKVVTPYIDSSNYLSSVVTPNTVAVQTPVTTVEQVKTVTTVKSPLDEQLEEGTQYIVKFKNSTIVAATILASIFLLMAVLFVVNIVNLVTMSAEVNALTQESASLNRSLVEGEREIKKAQAIADASGSSATYEVRTVKMESSYTEPTGATENGSMFDWMCHALSRLFN